MKMQWPVTREKKTGFIDEPLERQMRSEAGLTAIKGTEYTKLRVERADAGVSEIIQLKVKQLNLLMTKANGAEDLDARIDKLQKEVVLWTFYKQYKRASAPWATAGEDHDMSEKLRATEIFFFRNLDKPWMWNMSMQILQYISDVCYKEWHVAPAPTIIVQTMPTGSRGYPLEDEGPRNTEKIVRQEE